MAERLTPGSGFRGGACDETQVSAQPVKFRCRGCTQLITADFDIDGKPDLAAVNAYYGTITVLLNTTPFPTHPHSH